MPQFSYKAQGRNGLEEGVLEEADRQAVVRHLLSLGLRPLVVELQGKPRQKMSFNLTWPGRKREKKISGKELAFFTKELALLVQGGVGLDKALRLIRRQSDKETISSFAGRLEGKLKEGMTLSAALAEESAFSPMYANIVRAGEEGGVLPEMLLNIADYQARSRELKQFIISSSIYPIILLTMGIAILFILVAVILPRFKLLFAGMGQDLPLNVALLMGMADFVSNHFFLTLALFIAPPAALVWYGRRPEGRQLFDRLVVKTPIVRDFIRDMETTRIFRTLEVLVNNGVQFITALRISGGVAVNEHYRQLLLTATTALKEGQRVAPKLRGDLFPGLAVDLLAIGEESGRIGPICGQIASYFEDELRERLKRFITLLEPVFILVMAVGAGYIVLSMLTVILSMNDIAG
ncbi:MAG: type II secretion system F family protein [Thermodesulfobacteriota bacterium]